MPALVRSGRYRDNKIQRVPRDKGEVRAEHVAKEETLPLYVKHPGIRICLSRDLQR